MNGLGESSSVLASLISSRIYRRSEEPPSVLSPTQVRSRANSVYRAQSVSRSEIKWSYKPLQSRRLSEDGQSELCNSRSNASWRKSLTPSLLSARISDFLQKSNRSKDEWKKNASSNERICSKRSHLNGSNYSRESSRSPLYNGSHHDKINTLLMELTDERSNASMAASRLEVEIDDRIKLERELDELKKKRNADNCEDFQFICAQSADFNYNEDDETVSGVSGSYKERYKQAMRELEIMRHRLHTQHEDDMDQMTGLKKQLEKKLGDAFEEVEEQRQVVAQWKRKYQKLNSETNDLRLLIEEQVSRNNILEKKQRKFDNEFQLVCDELRQEKVNRERACREKEIVTGEKYNLDQIINNLKLELDGREQKITNLTTELDELTFSGATEEDVIHLKKIKHQLENKIKDQEEELDDLAGQVQMLEQSKVRLEVGMEQMRKDHRKEIQQKDEEFEEFRSNSYKKMKAIECQLEEEHSMRTTLVKERHEIEKKWQKCEDMLRHTNDTNQETVQKLKRDLKRTKALLKDFQISAEQTRESPTKSVIRQLKNQVEDVETARAIAVKARQALEAELADTNSALDDVNKSRNDMELRLATCRRESTEVQSRCEEMEEELNEVMKKYKVSVAQLSLEQSTLESQAKLISQLEQDKSSLQERLAEATTRLESMEGQVVSSLTAKIWEMKIKDLESRLNFEQVQRSHTENVIARLKENNMKLQEEINDSKTREEEALDCLKKANKDTKEVKEENLILEAHETELTMKYRDLEKQLETSKSEISGLKHDLHIATIRIDELQIAIEGQMEVDTHEDSESGSSDESLGTYLAKHNAHSSSLGSIDSYQSAERSFSDMHTKKNALANTKDSTPT